MGKAKEKIEEITEFPEQDTFNEDNLEEVVEDVIQDENNETNQE